MSEDRSLEEQSAAARRELAAIPELSPRARRRLFVLPIATILALLALGVVPRVLANRRMQAEATELENLKPRVSVVKPHRAAAESSVTLPGDARANQETAIFARATGYLKQLSVDVGSHVEANQLLAEIDAPEVDAQLLQAKAAASKAATDADLARSTRQRYEGFAKTGGVTAQQLDEKRNAERQSTSNQQAAQAEVQRLTDLQRFSRVTAPFAGTITARGFDVGSLIQATNNAAGKELFHLVSADILRVVSHVPQQYASSVVSGGKAVFLVRNFPGREFAGTVARTAQAIDPATRTLYAEIEIPNRAGELFPGMYGQVKIPLQFVPPIVIPSSAVLFDASGTRVALVNNGTVRLVTVTLGRDYGTEIEALSGIDETSEVVANPGPRIVDGASVEVERPQPSPAPVPAAGANAGGANAASR